MKQFKHTLLFGVLLLLGMSSLSAADNTRFSGSLDAEFSSWGSDSVEGEWRIIQKEGKHFIQLLDSFDAKEGPDVKIFLSKQSQTSITGDNATQNAVFISLVSSFEGSSEYEVPANIKVEDFKTLVFHCEAYSKLWGTGKIQ